MLQTRDILGKSPYDISCKTGHGQKTETKVVGHISRSSGVAKKIIQGTLKGRRRRGSQMKRWEDNIKE